VGLVVVVEVGATDDVVPGSDDVDRGAEEVDSDNGAEDVTLALKDVAESVGRPGKLRVGKPGIVMPGKEMPGRVGKMPAF